MMILLQLQRGEDNTVLLVEDQLLPVRKMVGSSGISVTLVLGKIIAIIGASPALATALANRTVEVHRRPAIVVGIRISVVTPPGLFKTMGQPTNCCLMQVCSRGWVSRTTADVPSFLESVTLPERQVRLTETAAASCC